MYVTTSMAKNPDSGKIRIPEFRKNPDSEIPEKIRIPEKSGFRNSGKNPDFGVPEKNPDFGIPEKIRIPEFRKKVLVRS